MPLILDDAFLEKVRDQRYSSEWVGMALRWRLDDFDKQQKRINGPCEICGRYAMECRKYVEQAHKELRDGDGRRS